MSTSEQALKKYAEHVRAHLMDHHFGTLPNGEGWVIYSNQGHSAKVERFLQAIKETYGTSEPVWDDQRMTAVVAMDGIGEDEPEYEDLTDLWCDASADEDEVNVVTDGAQQEREKERQQEQCVHNFCVRKSGGSSEYCRRCGILRDVWLGQVCRAATGWKE